MNRLAPPVPNDLTPAPSPCPAPPAIEATASMALSRVLNLALQAGLLAHQSGSATHATSLLMQRVARCLGAERVDVLISSTNVGITITVGNQSETAMRKAPHLGADFALLCALTRWVRQLEDHALTLAGAEDALAALATPCPHYPLPLVVGMVGLACGGFAALFGGDPVAIAITTLGAACGSAVKTWLARRHFSPAVFATVASFVALLLTGALRGLSATPSAALAASVLFLIPGVPLINAASDLLNANYLNGMVRLTLSAVVVFGIALGMSLALRMIGL
ncbi:Uncharacterized membrane protein YjjP, DUF1212 family [Andreprevotia lacus DSM 23236]|uniref:Uncharacterized membrane protein YjjP, DUF1212 family n=1 Tax=Andreprevotia lacus DSM 23236 TaxID=1121001 RepID=A0A1W1X967_9NEIS|nr:threonine/serine exporter family protein [Andreprevotia lacus]SMC20456.1 Uncharacterized membrane protein YjjP, DUF1212 family [Andreprevotia lacus DSM 23236]